MNFRTFRSFLTSECLPSEAREILKRNYFISPVHGTASGSAHSVVVNARAFQHPYDLKISSVMENDIIACSIQDKSQPFHSYQLALTGYSDELDLRALDGLRLELDGPELVMITSEMTGCVLVMQPSRDGSPYVLMAHIQPIGISHAELYKKLKEAPAYFKGEILPARLFGRTDQKNQKPNITVNVIALRQKKRWTLYFQEWKFTNNMRTIKDCGSIDLWM